MQVEEMKRKRHDDAILHYGQVEEFMKKYRVIKHIEHDIYCSYFKEYGVPVCPDEKNCVNQEKCHQFLLHSRIFDLSGHINRYRKMIVAQKNANEALIVQQNRKIEELRKEVNGLSSVCQDFQQQRTHANMRVEEKKKEIIELQKKLNEERIKNTRLENNIEKLEDKTTSLQQQLTEQKTIARQTKKPEKAKTENPTNDKILDYLVGRDGKIPGEIATALGINIELVYDALENLKKQGRIESEEGEDGIWEYFLP